MDMMSKKHAAALRLQNEVQPELVSRVALHSSLKGLFACAPPSARLYLVKRLQSVYGEGPVDCLHQPHHLQAGTYTDAHMTHAMCWPVEQAAQDRKGRKSLAP